MNYPDVQQVCTAVLERQCMNEKVYVVTNNAANTTWSNRISLQKDENFARITFVT